MMMSPRNIEKNMDAGKNMKLKKTSNKDLDSEEESMH